MQHLLPIYTALSFLLGYLLGSKDVPAVNNFTEHGSNPKDQRMFHWNGKASRALFVAMISAPFGWVGFFYFFACGAALWAAFDPTIARRRKAQKEFGYLSENSNETDGKLLTHLGKNAGLIKFWACVVLAITLNIVYYVRF